MSITVCDFAFLLALRQLSLSFLSSLLLIISLATAYCLPTSPAFPHPAVPRPLSSERNQDPAFVFSRNLIFLSLEVMEHC